MPSFELGGGGDLCELTEVVLDAGSGVGTTYYLWSDGSTLQTLNVSDPGMYSVTVTNTCGSLSDSAYFIDCPDCIIELPNAFSPNGDGKNDILYVVGFGFNRMQLMIFNRHGELIFESKDQAVGWDGTLNGIPQPPEAYYYYLNTDCQNGTEYRKKGDVTLVR
jgi:gliding motility-associated-like protein